MKVDPKNINRLKQHLNQQRALLSTLSYSHTKDIVQAQIEAIELSLVILGIKELMSDEKTHSSTINNK